MNVDSLIHDLEHRLHLDGKGKALLDALVALISGHDMGGLAGFAERFRKAGLGGAVDSWISGHSPAALTPAQVKSVLGGAAVDQVAHGAGLDASKAAAGLAALIPALLGKIADHGHLPHSLPAWLTGPAAPEVPGVSNERVSGIWILAPIILFILMRSCAPGDAPHAPAAHAPAGHAPAAEHAPAAHK